ncbi:hypothetical protein [Muribaculum intestinale]|uniref:hypothetical protein n=1 Tax=Muribaculum intestinale TaxID=1796646 RepID=UPI0025A4DB04|nr:hypothetical protein [Muribaculum intestinale]
MTQISPSDVIFACATQRGNRIADFRISGLDSMKAVVAELRRLAGGTFGLVRLTLRNATQGWCHSVDLYLNVA